MREARREQLSLQIAQFEEQVRGMPSAGAIAKADRRGLRKLPENRRRFAEQAVHRILTRFYGETIERIETIVDVALDAMEHDAYWEVLERINEARETDVGSFAEALEQFGLLELSTIGTRAAHRRTFLDFLDQLMQNAATHEKDAHKAFENNLWMLGRKYSMMSSNVTLKSVIATYCDGTFKGNRASKRPDLLLSQDYGDSYLLIEFKRPSQLITRDAIAQAEKYRTTYPPDFHRLRKWTSC